MGAKVEDGIEEHREGFFVDKIYGTFHVVSVGGKGMIAKSDYRRFGIDIDKALKDGNWDSVPEELMEAVSAFHKRLQGALEGALASEKARKGES
ncbi:MAG: hypothetical protein LBW85_09690 [Deltaproteobacteria bacterium]|jgi:hypothetical protein|nr:hypothetical protein [Deltaproteobacteria bacterium]